MYFAITLNYFAANIQIIYRNYAVIVSFFHRKETFVKTCNLSMAYAIADISESINIVKFYGGKTEESTYQNIMI